MHCSRTDLEGLPFLWGLGRITQLDFVISRGHLVMFERTTLQGQPALLPRTAVGQYWLELLLGSTDTRDITLSCQWSLGHTYGQMKNAEIPGWLYLASSSLYTALVRVDYHCLYFGLSNKQ